MSQKAEVPYDSSVKLADNLRSVELVGGDDFVSDKVLAQFVRWALLERSSKMDHQNVGSAIIRVFKKTLEKQPDADWPMVLCACRLSLEIAMEKHGCKWGTFVSSVLNAANFSRPLSDLLRCSHQFSSWSRCSASEEHASAHRIDLLDCDSFENLQRSE